MDFVGARKTFSIIFIIPILDKGTVLRFVFCVPPQSSKANRGFICRTSPANEVNSN